MINIEGMEHKFIIIKVEDIKKYLNSGWVEELNGLLSVIKNERVKEGKKENSYLVINTDEPYADEVIDIMKKNGHWRMS